MTQPEEYPNSEFYHRLVYSVWGIAESLVKQNRLAEAIVFLAGLLQSHADKESSSKHSHHDPSFSRKVRLTPYDEASIRIRVAELQLKLSDENAELARLHLEKALLLVPVSVAPSSSAPLKAHATLNLSCLCKLATIHASAKRWPVAKKILIQGCKLSARYRSSHNCTLYRLI
jgi:hypothetical protein